MTPFAQKVAMLSQAVAENQANRQVNRMSIWQKEALTIISSFFTRL
jgi:hypothetical protein